MQFTGKLSFRCCYGQILCTRAQFSGTAKETAFTRAITIICVRNSGHDSGNGAPVAPAAAFYRTAAESSNTAMASATSLVASGDTISKRSLAQ